MSAVRILAAMLAFAGALLTPALADSLYLRVQDIKGDVLDSDHKGWIGSRTFQHAVSRSIGQRPGSTKPQLSSLTVTKQIDASSPYLFSEATRGKPKEVELELVRASATRERYYRIKLYEALISGYSVSGADQLMEMISFDFVRMELTHTEYSKTGVAGSTTAWYDLRTQTGGIQRSNLPNTAPSISAIPNATTTEDTPVSVNFTISDAESASSSLILSAESSNPTLGTIAFSGSGNNRSAQIQPTANQNGSAVITIRVSDGTLSAASGFQLIVTPQNDAPTLGPIPPQTTQQDTPLSVNVVVGDVETPANNLALSASSDNEALIPAANVSFGGSGSNRVLALQPALGAFGQANISVTVSDGLLTASRTFLLAVNQRGVIDISLSNDHVSEGSAAGTTVGTLSATVSGATFTLADSAGGRFRIVGNELQVNAALDYEAAPAYSILVSAGASGAGEFTELFTIFVDDVNEPAALLVLDRSTIEAISGRYTAISRLQVSDPETNQLSLTLHVGTGVIRAEPAAGVNVTSNNSPRVVLSGTAAALNAMLAASNSIAYRANTGLSGSDLLSAYLADGPHTATETLAIRIYRSQYDQWLHTQFPEEYLADPTLEASLWGPNVDLDGDQLGNLAEYAIGTDIYTFEPLSPSITPSLSISVNRRIDPDLRLEAQVGSELTPESWSADPSVLEAFAPVDLGNGFERLQFADREPVTAGAKRFLRLRWTLNP